MANGRPTIAHRILASPPDDLVARVATLSQPAILEGGVEFGEAGRFGHFMANPSLVFEATGIRWGLTVNGFGDVSVAENHGVDPPLVALERLIERLGLADVSDRDLDLGPASFRGGLVGHFGYDLAPRLERLPRRRPRDSRMPDIRLALYDSGITFDHVTEKVEAWATGFCGESPTAVNDRLDRFVRAIETASAPANLRSSLGPVETSISKEDYLESVGRALEYIRAGDIFQVNLSQRFLATGRIEPFDLYCNLRRGSPAPFSAYLRWDDLAIVSASPEWFYRVDGDGRIVTRPIKGTRPRGTTPEEDRRLVDELLASSKDRAELTMIVDLERNDLGRVCEYGTIQVADAMSVETYAQVHHLVATVVGHLRDDVRPTDILRALFPGGSITGAPKIRAMEIIDELEQNGRGVYTGSIGYLGHGGRAFFNIAIRTLLVEGDRVSYQVGGGIVADSSPEAEYQETLHKGLGMRAVIEGGAS